MGGVVVFDLRGAGFIQIFFSMGQTNGRRCVDPGRQREHGKKQVPEIFSVMNVETRTAACLMAVERAGARFGYGICEIP